MNSTLKLFFSLIIFSTMVFVGTTQGQTSNPRNGKNYLMADKEHA